MSLFVVNALAFDKAAEAATTNPVNFNVDDEMNLFVVNASAFDKAAEAATTNLIKH